MAEPSPEPQGAARPRLILRPEEIAFALFATALVVIVAATGTWPPTFRPPLWHIGWRFHLYFVGCVGILGFVVARDAVPGADRKRQRRLTAMVRDFAPFYAVLVLYEALAQLTPVLCPEVRDASLVRIDRAVLGVDAAVWIGRFGSPLLSWVMAVCYGAYFIIPGALAAFLYAAGSEARALFRDYIVAGSLTAVLGFVGYLLVPAVGPYVFQADLFPTRLPGGAYAPIFIKAVDDFRGVARDCFPSLHAAHMTVALVFAYRFRRALFLVMLPVGLGLYVSTIYLRMHYVTDVAAGVALASLAVFAAPRLNRLMGTTGR
jgi:membrane-associated phospholipid phosphatase